MPGWLSVLDRWSEVGYSLCCKKATVVKLTGRRMENTATTLLVPGPVAVETVSSIYLQAYLQCEMKVERVEKGRKNHTVMW